MLETLRKSASGIVAKILMGLLILSFGIWGIADVFRGFGSQTLATIGSSEITVPEFRQLYQERLQQISQQLKRGITPDQARAFGLPDQVLNERLAEAALDDQASSLGLALSDEEIAKRVQQNPAFFGPSGSFDRPILPSSCARTATPKPASSMPSAVSRSASSSFSRSAGESPFPPC